MEDKYNIADYIKGRLNESEKSALEDQLKADAELEKEVTFYEEFNEFAQWKNKMDALDAELQTEAKVVTMKPQARVRTLGIRRVLSYAATICILLIAGGFWFSNANYSNQALSELNADRLGLTTATSRQGGNEIKDPFEQGIQALEQEQYEEAVQFFSTLPEGNEAWSQAQLHLAFAQYQLLDYESVIANSNNLIENNISSITRQKMEWLKLQALLAKGETSTEFQELLNEIAGNTQHLFQQEAMDLQSKMDVFWRKFVL